MAAPTFHVVGTLSQGTGAITPAPNVGHSANDVELLVVQTKTAQPATLSTPAGFAAVTGGAADDGAGALTVFWRRWNGSDGSPTVADSGDHQLAFILSYSGCTTTGNPWNVVGSNTQAATTSGSASGVTTTVVDTMIVVCSGQGLPNASANNTEYSAWANANLASVTERVDRTQAVGTGAAIGVADGAWASTGACGATTFTTATSAAKSNIVIALAPAATVQALSAVGAIASAEAFGTIVVTPGAVAITGVGAISSGEAFGLASVTHGFPQALSAVGAIASAEAFGTIVVVRAALPPVWPAVAEYVIEILDSGATFGPNAKLGELWDARNLGWSVFDRIPGKAFFTLSQRSSLLSLITPLTTHIRIWRLTPRLTTLVYNGAIIDYDAAGDDVVFSAFDYKALLSLSRSGYKTLYPTKAIGSQIVSPEWVLAKGATSSPLGFVTTGTIEDPLGSDNTTVIKTNNQFGLLDQMRLQLLFDLSEIGRANTVHHTTFEITRSTTPTFNFWKDKGSNVGLGLVLNGNVSEYRHLPNWTAYRNDLATIGTTVGGGAVEIVVKDDTAAAAKGRRQDVFTIKTLLGIVGAATTADQQQAASQRMLKGALALSPTLQLDMLRGSIEFFDGWDINDMPLVEIGNGIDTIAERWRIVGAHATFDEGGEQGAIIVQPVAA